MKGHPVPSHYLSNDCFVTIILVSWLVIVRLLISGVVVSVIITLMIRRLSSWDIRIISKCLLVTSTSTGSVIIFLVIIVIRKVPYHCESQNIKDFCFVLMCMFRQVYCDNKEFTTSFMVIVSGTANSKSIESKQGELAKKEKSRYSLTSLWITCGRLAHDRGPCPDTSNKYANKTNTPYVGSTAHALLVKETGNKIWIPNSNYNRPDKCKPATPASAPTGAPRKKPFEKKKDWTDTRRELLYALSPPSSSQTPNLLVVSLSSLS